MSLFVDFDDGVLFDALGLRSGSLNGQVALVTGAARGIGEHTAYALARLGAKVVLADISESGEQVAQKIRDCGGAALFVRTDVGDPQLIAHLLATVEGHFGPVDILINNAAKVKFGRLLEQPAALWSADYATNFLGPLMLIQSIVPQMISRQRGVVISLISLEGMPFMGNYCANKMALRSMMLSLGKEIPPGAGVSVLSVMPGGVDTPAIKDMIQSFSILLGMDVAEVRSMISNNPGYEGLVPVEHTAASLAWFCINAPQFHGQFVDGYLPLSKAGLIDVGGDATPLVESQVERSVLPNLELDLKELIQINRSLENRINERTRELEAANIRLEEASLTDPLTGLWNRRYADIAIHEEVASAMRKTEGVTPGLFLVMIDIDHFKHINDTCGHGVGDTVLTSMANVLRAQCRTSDKIIRWGGEEFLIIVRDIQGAQVEVLVERIRKAVEKHRFLTPSGLDFYCTCSLGFAALPISSDGTTMSWESVASMADLCMYAAKRSGRNRWIGMEVDADALERIDTQPSSWNVEAMVDQGLLNIVSSDPRTQSIKW